MLIFIVHYTYKHRILSWWVLYFTLKRFRQLLFKPARTESSSLQFGVLKLFSTKTGQLFHVSFKKSYVILD